MQQDWLPEMIPSVHAQLQWEPWALGNMLQSLVVVVVVVTIVFGLRFFGLVQFGLDWGGCLFVLFFFERSLSSGTPCLGGETDIRPPSQFPS